MVKNYFKKLKHTIQFVVNIPYYYFHYHLNNSPLHLKITEQLNQIFKKYYLQCLKNIVKIYVRSLELTLLPCKTIC